MMDLCQLYSIYKQHPIVITDSRKITSGCLFFALKGDHFDGNTFAGKALEMGAAFAIIDDKTFHVNEKCILVENVLDTLQQLALHHRKQLTIPVIAITGTNGKTTTKELSYAVLNRKYRTIATSGNLNNHIGVPLTLLSIRPDTEIALIEMGANHLKEIDFLCRLALPTHGLITNIGKAHLEGFGGFEGVIETKTELYQYMQSVNGTIFIHSGDELLIKRAEGITQISYGTTSESAVHGEIVSTGPYLCLDVFLPEKTRIRTQLFGSYNADNILAACCIGKSFQVDPEKIKQALEEYRPVNNRSQILQTTRNRLILDAYNANPSSMGRAIRDFNDLPGKNKVFILGDMLELGEESDTEHQKILQLLEEYKAEKVYLVGPVFLRINTKIEWHCFQDSDLAKLWLGHHQISGADVLLKGSRGIQLEKVVAEL